MTKRILLPLLLAVCCTALAAQDATAPGAIGVRYSAPNYLLPITDDFNGDDFGSGLEIEYARRITEHLNVSFPFRINSAQRRTNLFPNRPDLRDREFVGVSGDILFHLVPFSRQTAINPSLFVGLSALTDDFEAFEPFVPLGAQLNIRLGNQVYFSPRVSYRASLDRFRDDYVHAALGIQLFLSTPEPKVPPVVDTDGDGILDPVDRCPTVPGTVAAFGCPDRDEDGIADADDKCPDVAGLSLFAGCPDTDGDNIADPDDDCPEVPGIPEKNGCPVEDRDKDGIEDANDKCPDVAGTVAMMGCPDSDGDGVADPDDDCPNAAGPAGNNGCPDTDGDGVLDKDDRCPNEAGPAGNLGCPEITVEDQKTIEFAIQNVNFSTGKAILTPDDRVVLDKIVDIMQRYPAYNLAIGGHTDSVGSAESNQALSERRAQATYDYILSKGINARRMTSRGFGEEFPIATNINAAGREQNRRVEFDLTVQ